MYRELEKIAFIPNPGKDALYERLLKREQEMAAARGLEYSPGMRMSGRTPGPHPAMEKSVIKGTGPGIGQKVKHHTLGKVRRLWSQPGKYRWLRRGGLIGGVAGLGLLGKAWMDSAKNDKLLKEEKARGILSKYSTTFDYTPNAPVTPKPPKFPSMPAPMSTNAGVPTTGIPEAQKAFKPKGPKFSGESAEMKVATTNDILAKVAFLDEGIGPLIAGLAGGAGGYYAGKKVIDPIFSMGQQRMRQKIDTAKKIIAGLEKGKKVAPFAGATVGAILLAALAAKHAKKKERETMAKIIAMGGTPQEGFDPRDRRSVSDPMAGYYG